MAAAFRKAVEQVPPITVELLSDRRRWALGTIVSTDGYILTKASELYGSISCRLADGRDGGRGAGAGQTVVKDFRRAKLQGRPIDQIQVCPHPGLDCSAVGEADQRGGVSTLSLYEPFEVELRTSSAIPTVVCSM